MDWWQKPWTGKLRALVQSPLEFRHQFPVTINNRTQFLQIYKNESVRCDSKQWTVRDVVGWYLEEPVVESISGGTMVVQSLYVNIYCQTCIACNKGHRRLCSDVVFRHLSVHYSCGVVRSYLVGCFLGIPSLYVFSFFNMFFCDLFQLFFFGGEGGGSVAELALDPQCTCMLLR